MNEFMWIRERACVWVLLTFARHIYLYRLYNMSSVGAFDLLCRCVHEWQNKATRKKNKTK